MSRLTAYIVDVALLTVFTLIGMWVADNHQEYVEKPHWFAQTNNAHLGAEYNSIAQSLFAGRGYSDPFRVESGPTAWMPPVMPYLLLFLYWLTDFRVESVIDIILSLKAFAIVSSGLIVLSEARRLRLPIVGYVAFLTMLFGNFRTWFQVTHDEWLICLMINLIWLSLRQPWHLSFNKIVPVGMGTVGGFASLCSPILGGVWIILITLGSVAPTWILREGKSRSEIGNRRIVFRWIAIMSIAFVVVMPWTIRNRMVLGKWIPIKSNGVFELWQSQCLDDDGVLDNRTLALHPYLDDDTRREYNDKGEISFVDGKWPIVRNAIAENPWDYGRRILKRALAATIVYPKETINAPKSVWLARVIFPVPFAALIVVVALFRARAFDSAIFVTILFYISFLTPYVLISYYDRYGSPLLTIKSLVIVYAISSILMFISKLHTARASRGISKV